MDTPADPADLIAWLRAQLDYDAALIERNSGQRGITDEGIFPDYRTYDGEDLNAADAYLVGFNPKRMLAELDAKRRILDLHALIWRDIGWLETDEDGSRDEAHEELEVCGYCVRKHSSFATRADVPTGPCLTVRLLAMPYAGRLGYQEEWKP